MHSTMTEHIAFVTAVDAKHIDRPNGQSFDLWQIHDSDNNIWVVKKPLADFARALVGQQAQFTTRTEQKPRNDGNGFYENYYADQIIPLASVQAAQGAYPPYSNQQQQQPQPTYQPAQQAQQAQQQQQPVPPAPVQPVQQQVQQQQPWRPTEKDYTIWRQTAAKVAASLAAGDQYVFWTLLPELMEFFVLGKRPANIENAEVFAQRTVNASAEGASMTSYQDEDIPFAPTSMSNTL
jgi:hypothetical protein